MTGRGLDARLREALIFGAFALLCAAAAFTVLLPETQDDRDEEAGAPAAAESPGGDSS